MARCLSLMVCVSAAVVWFSAHQGVNSCFYRCISRCDVLGKRRHTSRWNCYPHCRKLATICEFCSGPRRCFMCKPRYLLTANQQCEFNKCLQDNGDCDADATCSRFWNRFGGINFKCECNIGYSGDGTSCTDVDECLTNNGGCSDHGDVHATCSNNIGSFTCSCSNGFTEKGTSCIDNNECGTDNTSCRADGDTNAVCVNKPGSFTCTCSIGFAFNGTTCNSLPITLTSIIELGMAVFSLALKSDYLYVATAINVIPVYNATSLQLVRQISVTGGRGAYFGMVISPNNDYLYATDNNEDTIFKEPLSSGTPSNWQYACGPSGLAINRKNNLLVACNNGQIREYPSNGGLASSVADANGLNGIWVLSNGNLAVTRLGPVVGVAVLSNDGSEQHSYGSTTPGATVQMSSPVAVTSNSQVYVLNPTLSQARTLSLPISGGLNAPTSIWLDESRGVLFVGEHDSGRVLVFSNVNAYKLTSAFAT